MLGGLSRRAYAGTTRTRIEGVDSVPSPSQSDKSQFPEGCNFVVGMPTGQRVNARPPIWASTHTVRNGSRKSDLPTAEGSRNIRLPGSSHLLGRGHYSTCQPRRLLPRMRLHTSSRTAFFCWEPRNFPQIHHHDYYVASRVPGPGRSEGLLCVPGRNSLNTLSIRLALLCGKRA